MKLAKYSSILVLSLALSGCIKEENYGQILVAGLTALQATTLSEKQVKQSAHLGAKEYDAKNKVAPASSHYSKRLNKLTANLQQVDGITLNYKVYLDPAVNAFAMADGTVRVYSGLLDLMPDDQVLAVIGHEIGHVKLKHSYQQMKKQLLTSAAFQAAGATQGAVGDFSASQLGAVTHKAINSKFSQTDELQADQYSLKFLRGQGRNPAAMRDSILTLQKKYGSGGGFLSSHPSNQQRIDNINKSL